MRVWNSPNSTQRIYLSYPRSAIAVVEYEQRCSSSICKHISILGRKKNSLAIGQCASANCMRLEWRLPGLSAGRGGTHARDGDDTCRPSFELERPRRLYADSNGQTAEWTRRVSLPLSPNPIDLNSRNKSKRCRSMLDQKIYFKEKSLNRLGLEDGELWIGAFEHWILVSVKCRVDDDWNRSFLLSLSLKPVEISSMCIRGNCIAKTLIQHFLKSHGFNRLS